MFKIKIYPTVKEIITWALIGAMAGCLIVFFLNKYFFGNKNDREFTVQQRTMFTLGLLWDEKDTHICKTKNYVVKVKIVGGCDKAYYGQSYPIVSINGSSFVKAKAYGDFLSDRQEWVFYHDNNIEDDRDFTVRFDWFRPNENQQNKPQCYFEINKNDGKDTISEYGQIIVDRPDKNRGK